MADVKTREHDFRMELLNWLREQELSASLTGRPVSLEVVADFCTMLAYRLLRAPAGEPEAIDASIGHDDGKVFIEVGHLCLYAPSPDPETDAAWLQGWYEMLAAPVTPTTEGS